MREIPVPTLFPAKVQVQLPPVGSSHATEQATNTMDIGLALPFYDHFLKTPSRVALHVDGVSYSYGELGAIAGRIAALLRDRGNIERVGILAGRSVEAYAGILAAAWAGATFVPLNPKYPEERLLSIIRRSRLDAVVLDRSGAGVLTPRVLNACPALLLAPALEEETGAGMALVGRRTIATQAMSVPPVRAAAEKNAYILFTSGTTGEPKGVMVTNANVAHFLRVSQERYCLGPEDRLSQQSELTFDHIVFDLFMAWGYGAGVYVVPENMVMAPAEFIRQQGLTVWFAVPSVISFLKEMKLLRPGIFPSLRLSLFAGEPLPRELADAWQEAAPHSRIDNLYGPTEATVDCLWQPYISPLRITPGRGVVAIGQPYEGMCAEIVDVAGNFLKSGEVGELAVSGPQVSAGYLDNPELTARRYPCLKHPELGASTWYLTGDLSYRDADGIFHYLGRVDNQVKVMGQRLELEDVEFHLRAVCQRDSVAVIGWPVKYGTAQGLVAFVTGEKPDQRRIKEILRHRLQAYMVPRRIVHLEKMPLNLNGKVDRKALADLLAAECDPHG